METFGSSRRISSRSVKPTTWKCSGSLRAAILAGQIDLYPEYTGNGALFFHLDGDQVWKDWTGGAGKVAALDREKNQLVWLAEAPDNST